VQEREPGTKRLGADPEAGGAIPPAPEVSARLLTDELAGILTAAEESAAKIVERAQASTEQQIAEANRLWRDVQLELTRVTAWRKDVEPIFDQLRERLAGVRGLVEAVPERIRRALTPIADAMSSVETDLARLDAATTPPPLETPPGLKAKAEEQAKEGPEDIELVGSDELGENGAEDVGRDDAVLTGSEVEGEPSFPVETAWREVPDAESTTAPGPVEGPEAP
jgi:hypothetical protein